MVLETLPYTTNNIFDMAVDKVDTRTIIDTNPEKKKSIGEFSTKVAISKVEKSLKNLGFSLLGYQVEGVKWLIKRESKKNEVRGGLLCDEMGLGKTLQILSLIKSSSLKTNLIVVPANLIYQWRDEILKFAPEVKTTLLYGAKKFDINIDTDIKQIFLTTYSTLVRGLSFDDISFDRLICDEVHYIRNNKAKCNRVIKSIKSKVRFGITGTPIQNYITDFTTLIQFIGVKLKPRMKLEDLRELASEYILHRTKSELKNVNETFNIPDYKSEDIFLDFKSKEEQDFYKIVESCYEECDCEEYQEAVLKTQEENKERGVVDYKDTQPEKYISNKLDSYRFPEIYFLEKFLRLRQASILPKLIVDGYSKKFKKEYEDWKFSNTRLDFVADSVEKTKKTIIFTHFREEIKYLYEKLKTEENKIAIIDGSMNSEVKNMVVRNAEKFDILLIQINSGSTGLNLQCFTEVIFTAPAWNPYVQYQAIARCHRIGQTQTVTVKNIFMKSTIDESIIQIQKCKNMLCESLEF